MLASAVIRGLKARLGPDHSCTLSQPRSHLAGQITFHLRWVRTGSPGTVGKKDEGQSCIWKLQRKIHFFKIKFHN